MSWSSVGVAILKDKKTKVLMPELPQHSGSTGHFGSKGSLFVFFGKTQSKRERKKKTLHCSIRNMSKKGGEWPRQWTKLLALCQKVIIFHFIRFSFRAQHFTVFPSVLLTYSNTYIKANFNYLFYNWNDTQNDGNKISVKSRENLQKCDILASLFSKLLSDALILKDEHKPTILMI